ncbi:hypothetical protein KIF59_06770 [Enterobacter cloacae subsp. cloacae]|nr:hypothetical protein [Enterobacter cloacae subsp. cloacae]
MLARILGASVAGAITGLQRCGRPADEVSTRLSPACCSRRSPKFRTTLKSCASTSGLSCSVVGIINFPVLLGLMVVSSNFVPLRIGEKWNSIIPILQLLCVVGLLRSWVTRLAPC